MGKLKQHYLDQGSPALSTSRKRSNAQVTPALAGHRQIKRGKSRADRTWSRTRFLDLVRRLMAKGHPVTGKMLHWSLSAHSRFPCVSPVHVWSIHAMDLKPAPKTYRGDVEWLNGVFGPVAVTRWCGGQVARPIGVVQVFARCRKCENCRSFTRRQWIARTIVEARKCPGRIWFVTLTANKAYREYLDLLAAAEAARTRQIFARMSDPEKFSFRAIALKREVARYNKRLRKGYGRKAPCRFRFLCVTEPHKDDMAHAHVLYFEHGGAPLQERLFRARWRPRGFAQAKLVESPERVARYVSKYITKDFSGTVHGSLSYGAA